MTNSEDGVNINININKMTLFGENAEYKLISIMVVVS